VGILGSNELTDNGSKENRKQTIEFIEREFSDERSQNVRWRFCIQHKVRKPKIKIENSERKKSFFNIDATSSSLLIFDIDFSQIDFWG
jgi:hypothetical protein